MTKMGQNLTTEDTSLKAMAYVCLGYSKGVY